MSAIFAISAISAVYLRYLQYLQLHAFLEISLNVNKTANCIPIVYVMALSAHVVCVMHCVRTSKKTINV